MARGQLKEDFYERLTPRLYERIGRTLRLAGTLVDVGCGGCDLVRYLAETYHQKVFGVDLSDAAFPRKRRTSTGVRFHCLQRDAARLEDFKPESLDAAVSKWALHEYADPLAVLREVHRLLRPGGEVLLVDFPKGSLASELWGEHLTSASCYTIIYSLPSSRESTISYLKKCRPC